MPCQKHPPEDHGYCRQCPNKVVNVYAVEPRCAEGPCANEQDSNDDDILTPRKSDWAALTGPITFPGQARKQGWPK